jgi:integrase
MGILVRNPADAVDVPKVTRREVQAMSESDIHIFLEYSKNTGYYPLFYLALFTGMRRSELLALRWSDVDLILCQISVFRTIHQLHNGEIIFRQPKTAKGRPMIALSPSTCHVLREHRERQETERLLGGKLLQETDLVFSQPDGKPLLPDTISHAFVVIAKRIGLNGIHLHSCRHSHASLLLKKNTHPAVVMQRLGHSSITVTINTYSHVMPSL